MANISKQKRGRMIEFLETLKKEHTDDESIRAFTEIENHIREKKYGLVWEEHTEHVDEMLVDNIPIFTEDVDRRICLAGDQPYNFIIEGDNLQSLYLLEKTHKNCVDVIYIDPPYNRGKDDFIYDDNFIEITDSYRHSKWISFMSERLQIARNLLSERGVIFISIDDNEYANLKLICDEIFSEGNFVTTCVWQKIHSIKNDAKHLSVNHDYVLIYAKNIDCAHFHLLDRTEEMNARYTNPDNDPRGAWQSGDLVANEVRTNGNYDVVGPTGKVFNVPEGKHWVYSEDNMKELIRDNRIWFGRSGTAFPRKKRFLSEVQEGRTPDTWWKSDEVGHNQEGARDLKKVLGTVALNNPKPLRLIKRIIDIAAYDNSIILDFFAGSGTTAQAVIEHNNDKNKNLQFIICTNNEITETRQQTYFIEKGYIDSPPTRGKNAKKAWREKWDAFKESEQYKREVCSDSYQSIGICHSVTYPRIRTVIHGSREDGSVVSGGIGANLKYLKCDWTPRKPEDYMLNNVLCLHIKEMIELQNGIEVDNVKNVLILNKDDFRNIVMKEETRSHIENIWVNQNIIFNADELEILKGLDYKYIPKEFFGQELKEAAE